MPPEKLIVSNIKQMTRQSIMLLTAQLLISLSLNSQVKVSSAEYDEMVSNHKEVYTFDSLYCSIEDSLMQLGMEYVAELQEKFNYVQRLVSGGCLSPDGHKKISQEITKDIQDFNNFENYVVDSLPKYKENLLLEIELSVREVSDRLAKNEYENQLKNPKFKSYYNSNSYITDHANLYKNANRILVLEFSKAIKKINNLDTKIELFRRKIIELSKERKYH